MLILCDSHGLRASRMVMHFTGHNIGNAAQTVRRRSFFCCGASNNLECVLGPESCLSRNNSSSNNCACQQYGLYTGNRCTYLRVLEVATKRTLQLAKLVYVVTIIDCVLANLRGPLLSLAFIQRIGNFRSLQLARQTGTSGLATG